MQFKVYFVPTKCGATPDPSDCFMVYEGSNMKAADFTHRAAVSWIKEQRLPLRVVFDPQT